MEAIALVPAPTLMVIGGIVLLERIPQPAPSAPVGTPLNHFARERRAETASFAVIDQPPAASAQAAARARRRTVRATADWCARQLATNGVARRISPCLCACGIRVPSRPGCTADSHPASDPDCPALRSAPCNTATGAPAHPVLRKRGRRSGTAMTGLRRRRCWIGIERAKRIWLKRPAGQRHG